MFYSKTVNDLTESIIHSHRRFIYVRRFTFVHEVNGEESNFEVLRVCSFVCCNGVCKSGLSSTKTKFEWHTPTRHKGI